MSWPIILKRSQSDAVLSATRSFYQGLEGEARAIYAVLLNQMDRGLALDPPEQELLQHALLSVLKTNPNNELETAYFRLYGVWVVSPPWWRRERDKKKSRRNT